MDSSKKDKPRTITRAILEKLGYRVSKHGIQHPTEPFRIMALERIEDGTTADFTYVCHPTKDMGFISEHSLDFFKARVRLKGKDKNES